MLLSNDYSPKPIEELMKHLKDSRGIEVKSEQTRQMLNYGYYHAYKGYRFFKNSKSKIPYTSFEQIIAVIDYDNALKAAFYPEIMFLETALKNIVVATVIEGLPSAKYTDVMKERMNDEKGNDSLQRQRRRLKEKINSTISKRYSQNDAIISHFCDKGDEAPIWAIFEIMSLGDFSTFTYCLNKYTRVSLLRELHMFIDEDPSNQLLSSILYTLKDIRNALAHNNIIFDTRFTNREISASVCCWLSKELKIDEIDFSSIIDYYLLLAVLLQKIEYGDEKIESFILEVESCFYTLEGKVPENIYKRLTSNKCDLKLQALSAYIEKYQ